MVGVVCGDDELIAKTGKSRQELYDFMLEDDEVMSYAKYHQSGGVNNLVARPFLGLSVDDKSTINELIESFINGDL